MTTTPNARVILPAEATEEMMRGAAYAGYRHVGASESEAEELTERLLAKQDQASFSAAQWAGVVAASPNAGKVSEAELRIALNAFVAVWASGGKHISEQTEAMCAALSALGLEVEG